MKEEEGVKDQPENPKLEEARGTESSRENAWGVGCGFIFKNGNFIMAMRFFTVSIHTNVKNIFLKFF